MLRFRLTLSLVALCLVLLCLFSAEEAEAGKILKKRKKAEGDVDATAAVVEKEEEKEMDEDVPTLGKRRKRLIRRKKVKKEDDSKESEASSESDEGRQGRRLVRYMPKHKKNWKTMVSRRSNKNPNYAGYYDEDPPYMAAPYTVDAHDLLALESGEAVPTTPAYGAPVPVTAQQIAAAQAQPTAYPDEGAYFQYIDHPSIYEEEEGYYVPEKRVFGAVANAIGGIFGGGGQNQAPSGSGPSAPSGTGEGPNLVMAALPVAMAGFVALAFSSLFANQMNVNATAKEEQPLLWKVPIEYGKTKRSVGNDDDDSIFENEVDTGSFGNAEAFVGALFGNFPRLSAFLSSYLPALSTLNAATDYARRFKDGMLLYSLMETDSECQRKVACTFGGAVRSSGHKGLLVNVVRQWMPEEMREGFTEPFLRSARASEGGEDCSVYTCSKCFSL